MFLNSCHKTNDPAFKRISANLPKLKVFSQNIIEYNSVNDRNNFEWLYDKFAPKAYGFITRQTDSKEQAEEYLTNVFLKVWEDIKSFDDDAEKKIQQIVLMICKPLYKQRA